MFLCTGKPLSDLRVRTQQQNQMRDFRKVLLEQRLKDRLVRRNRGWTPAFQDKRRAQRARNNM
jgi:hypothetical protein